MSSPCECSICYNIIDNRTTGRVELSCGHLYHFSCIATWFNEVDKSSCPMCRKEMMPIEDLPPANDGEIDDESDEDEDVDEDEDEELEISRADLDALMRSLGGIGITETMVERLFPDESSTLLIHTEFNNLCMGNGARVVDDIEWHTLCTKSDTLTLQITIHENNEREVVINHVKVAATQQ